MQREFFPLQHLGLSPRLQRAKLREIAKTWSAGTVERDRKGKLRKAKGYDRAVTRSKQRETKAERAAAECGGTVYQRRRG